MPKIVLYPDKILRVKTPLIKKVDDELLKNTRDLFEVLESKDNGAGLAAPQIGVAKRFFGMKERRKEGNVYKLFINPRITNTFGQTKSFIKLKKEDGREEDFLEGCLSFPNLFGTVKRWLKIEAEWEEIKGKELVMKKGVLGGFEAIVFQHETDHLDGILFTDHVLEDKGKLYEESGKELKKADINKVIKEEKETVV